MRQLDASWRRGGRDPRTEIGSAVHRCWNAVQRRCESRARGVVACKRALLAAFASESTGAWKGGGLEGSPRREAWAGHPEAVRACARRRTARRAFAAAAGTCRRAARCRHVARPSSRARFRLECAYSFRLRERLFEDGETTSGREGACATKPATPMRRHETAAYRLAVGC